MVSLAVLLFIVMDPFGNIITINTLLSDIAPSKRWRIVLRESVIAMCILLGAVFGGEAILGVLGLEAPSLRISGGIVLFLIALGMLFPKRKVLDEFTEELPLVVPIAMPLIAGPSAISIVILFSQEQGHMTVSGAVLLASAASAALLIMSPKIFEFLGRRGSLALERLMGMLLIMLSVQMILDGLKLYFKLQA